MLLENREGEKRNGKTFTVNVSFLRDGDATVSIALLRMSLYGRDIYVSK